MNKITIKKQEFDGILFDGRLESAVEILKELKKFPYSTVVRTDMNIDPDMVNCVLHLYIVNGQVLIQPNGQFLNTVYFQVGQGEVILFADNIVTVINHKLLDPLGVTVNGQDAGELDRINESLNDFDSMSDVFGYDDEFEDEDNFEKDDDRFIDKEH